MYLHGEAAEAPEGVVPGLLTCTIDFTEDTAPHHPQSLFCAVNWHLSQICCQNKTARSAGRVIDFYLKPLIYVFLSSVALQVFYLMMFLMSRNDPNRSFKQTEKCS